MSNMLKEKRAEFVAKLSVLEATRQAEIDSKVLAYRKSLEESTPKDEILKVTNVIAALDEVIGYESTNSSTSEHVSVAIETEPVVIDAESITHSSSQARPGMANVFTPNR